MNKQVTIRVAQDDVTAVDADMLLLKYARSFHGADEAVAIRLLKQGTCSERDIAPDAGEVAIIESNGAIAADRVVFIGTQRLGKFRYKEMRGFAKQAIEVIGQRNLAVRKMLTTVHGAGYGLDIEEAIQAMVFGFQQGIATGAADDLEEIVFVERNPSRFEVLRKAVAKLDLVKPDRLLRRSRSDSNVTSAAKEPPRKKCVFVAMPFEEEFEDVYQFGIYAAVRRCGYVCERVDESIFAGSIIERITEGIRDAEFVVADLTHEKPNVYLEVGYAWGLERPVIMVAREGQRLHFDLAHHKCLFYRTIGKLSEELEETIRKMFGTGKNGPESSGP